MSSLWKEPGDPLYEPWSDVHIARPMASLLTEPQSETCDPSCDDSARWPRPFARHRIYSDE